MPPEIPGRSDNSVSFVGSQSGEYLGSLARVLRLWLVPACITALLLSSFLSFILLQKVGFTTFREVGYGDSYILSDVLRFEKTGIIYHSRTQPPYLPAQYSPFVYILYSLSRYFHSANVFLGPRLIAFAVFAACLGMAVSIARKLIPDHAAWLWGLALLVSTQTLQWWVLQLRGDFVGIFFGLASMRLLMSGFRHSAPAAGLCAGMAIQIKLTLISSAVAAFLWLLTNRRWREAAVFAAGVSVTSLGFFYAWWLREPDMLNQMTVLMPGISELHGCVAELSRILGEPVALLAVLAAPSSVSRAWLSSFCRSGWCLMAIYVVCAFGFGFLADLQVGGNINYFFEAVTALVPFSVLGLFRLFSRSRRSLSIALFAAAMIVFRFLVPDLTEMFRRREEFSAAAILKVNRQLMSLEAALHARRILSVDPRVALFDPDPALMEPYLLSYMRRMGRFDPSVLIARISASEFDVFITPIRPMTWRGISGFEGNDLRDAVAAAYKPYCTVSDDLVQLPRGRFEDPQLRQALEASGCEPLGDGPKGL